MPDFARARDRMLEAQIARRGVRDPAVLAAMRAVPREAFVPGAEAHAYDDGPLPIGENQTISQPYVVALMAEAAGIGPGDRVLEVGAGSGYAAAVLAQLADRVFAIERHRSLAEAAARRLADLGYANVEIRTGDGSAGWQEAAPFDAVIVSAGAPRVPEPLRDQLALGGRLVIPLGDTRLGQRLVKLTRTGEAEWTEVELGLVAFVPLVGAPEDGRP